MNISKKLLASVLAFSMLSGIGMTAPVSEPVPASAAAIDDTCDDWLHAEGSRLYDMNGNEVWLTGANWFGMNCTENFPHGLWSADADVLLSSVADHGINCIRFPVSTELLVSWMNGTPLEPVGLTASNDPYYVFNPDFCDENGDTMDSMGIFDVLMQKMKKYGIKAIIDVHSPASHNSGHNYTLWYHEPSAADADNMAIAADGTVMTTELWIESLVWLADKYKNDDTIIAYDLKNEPHGKREYSGTECPAGIAKWDDSTDENNWAYAATECANAILEVNPYALILVEGVEQYPKTELGYTYDTPDIWGASAENSPWYGAWWGGNLRGVRDYPITPDSGTTQIVYSPHDYGPSVYAQTWFDKEFTTQTLLDDYWYDTWAYIVEENIAPLLIGEWGGHMDAGKNQKWMELLRNYMIENHINHTFWCINPNSGDTGGLLDSSFGVWDDEKYGLMETSLWQTQESGLYVGLDHQTPLGTNGTGVSLNEFYTTYAVTEGSNIDGGTILSEAGDPVIIDGTVSSYAITKSEENCTISLSANAAQEGDTVTFTLASAIDNPASVTVSVKTLSGAEVSYTESNGTYTFVMPAEKVTVTAVYEEGASEDIVYGDANGDGKVNATDATLASRHSVGVYTLSDDALTRCDVNGDGKINATDATLISRFAVGVIEKLPI